jgi:hypothetical protein
MPGHNSSDDDVADHQIGRPGQFRLIDLYAFMTIFALVIAMVAPIVRQIRSDHRWVLVVILCSQASIIAVVMNWESNKRKKLLNISGRRIGVGYCGDLNWRHWPLAKSLLIMLFIGAAQVTFAVAVASIPDLPFWSPGFIFQQVQLSLFFAFACSRYMWRVFPNSMEFYEHGISSNGTSLIPWNRISIRDSQFFPGRIVMVIRTKVGSIEADTIVVQVSDFLRMHIAEFRGQNSETTSASVLTEKRRLPPFG